MGWLSDTLFGTSKSKDRASLAASTSAEAIRAGAEQAAVGQQVGGNVEARGISEGIDFLQQREQLPIELRDEALQGLRGYYQVPGQLQAPMGQQELIDQAMSSPLYREILGGRRAGEEAILRQRSATGGLRSGGSQKDLYDYNIELENRALLGSYYEAQEQDYYNLERQDLERLRRLQGVESFAALGGNEDLIAQYMADKGSVLGGAVRGAASIRGQGQIGYGEEISQGILSRAQIGAQGQQNIIDLGMGVAGLGIQAKKVGFFSDIRLKDDIRYLGSAHGLNFYGWTWNERAKELGLEGECSGLMAHEVYTTHPEAISEKDNYLQLNYSKIEGIH